MGEILVAIDASTHADRIIDEGIELAKDTSSKILLVHVMNVPSKEPEGVAAFEKAESYPDAYAEYLKELAENITEKYSEKIEKAGVEYRVITPSGNPAAEILEVAKLEKVSTIIVGLKGLHGLARIRSLGSVARRVVEHSTIPVLVVPSSD